MKDKWIQDLHDRMEDYEMDAPDGLWEVYNMCRSLREM